MEYNKQAPPPGFVDSPPPYNVTSQPTVPIGAFAGGPPMVVVAPISLTGQPQRMNCPHCHADVLTEVKYKDGRMTHIWALVLCLVGCWCCCCIPYCIDDLKDVDHECPNCQRHIGTYKR
ncbi:unnamed protein product [Allacma fusca]|uniref:LITAF domain-containing protein n=1 Tax=Allacma fusca TaxID=39272 RepID=A0A8J2LCJ5_9HEXA|nr:unnamed protein product [Allacma fusca]